MKKAIILTAISALAFSSTAFAGDLSNCNNIVYDLEFNDCSNADEIRQKIETAYKDYCDGEINWDIIQDICNNNGFTYPEFTTNAVTTEATTQSKPVITETTTEVTTQSKPVITETTTEVTTQSKPVITETTTEVTTQSKPIITETTTQSKPIITETTTQSKPVITETTTETTTQSKPVITEATTEVTTQSKPVVTETTETTTETTVDSSTSGYASQVLNLVNQERAKYGLSSLTLNNSLSNVAQKKAEDMMNNNYFSHTSPTYGTPFEMMKSFGISYNSAAENIAKGQQTPEAVVQAWLNSEGHRKNILSSSYTQMGLGFVKGNTTYWSQMFIG